MLWRCSRTYGIQKHLQVTSRKLPPPEWNATARDHDRSVTVPDLTRAAARLFPGAPAVVNSMHRITHAELDERSDHLSHLLLDLGVRTGDVVALYSDRNINAIVSLLAVLKAGAAYVPLDPSWPDQRTVALLDELSVRVVLCSESRLDVVQRLRWAAPDVEHVVCPDVVEARTWAHTLDREAVQDLFDFLATEPDPAAAAGFTLRDDQELHDGAAVTAYVEHVVDLVASVQTHPGDVLEIGCGSGLLTAALAPRAERYLATDLAPQAVARALADAGGAENGLSGRVCCAHEVAEQVAGPFDLVIMASTVQFFPDLEYLLDVVDALTSLVRDQGKIVIVDLLDPESSTYPGLRVPPSLLRALPDVVPGICAVDVRLRDTSRLTTVELRKRYDVVLTVRQTPSSAPRRRTTWTAADLADTRRASAQAPVRADDVAYAIFTSGSTGTPKAVLVDHRAVVNLIGWMTRTNAITQHDRVLSVASFCFDLSVWDIFGALAAGASVHLATEVEISEPDSLIDIMLDQPVTIWDSAPAALSNVIPFLPSRSDLGMSRMRLFLLSGDWIPLALPSEVRAAFPTAEVVAMGGATECTVWSNRYLVERVDRSWASIPYGRPMDNARYHVLDAELAPCAVGEPGDLYIAGDCVALGYAKAPQLTAARFLPDPWPVREGGRMYKTGDRARWLPTGDVEFLGRLDDQVKIRGFRIELAEVLSAVSTCPGVRSATVLVVDDPAGKRLVAFCIPRVAADQLVQAVRRHASLLLPPHMVPSRVVVVDAFPLRPTGKVDREALAASLTVRPGSSKAQPGSC